MPVFVPEPRIETNLMRQVEAENAGRLQTANCNENYPLDGPFVRYRPEGYTVQLEAMLHNPREVLLVTFPEPINLFDGYDRLKRILLRDYIAFYRSTASSYTSILAELKDTWFPTFGVSPAYDIIKVGSLKPIARLYSWRPYLDMYVSLQQKLDPKADRTKSPYVYMFGIQSDPELLIKELAARTSSWRFLRISAAIGGGLWAKEAGFRDFVLTHNCVDSIFSKEALPAGLAKSPVFKTTQVCSGLNEREEPLFKCRLPPVFSMTEGEEGAKLVEYTGASV